MGIWMAWWSLWEHAAVSWCVAGLRSQREVLVRADERWAELQRGLPEGAA